MYQTYIKYFRLNPHWGMANSKIFLLNLVGVNALFPYTERMSVSFQLKSYVICLCLQLLKMLTCSPINDSKLRDKICRIHLN